MMKMMKEAAREREGSKASEGNRDGAEADDTDSVILDLETMGTPAPGEPRWGPVRSPRPALMGPGSISPREGKP